MNRGLIAVGMFIGSITAFVIPVALISKSLWLGMSAGIGIILISYGIIHSVKIIIKENR